MRYLVNYLAESNRFYSDSLNLPVLRCPIFFLTSLNLWTHSFKILLILCRGRRTKKVGICGKYGTRYGATLRKIVKKMEVTQHSKYTCAFCGRDTVKRACTGIWKCNGCNKVTAGGAYVLWYVMYMYVYIMLTSYILMIIICFVALLLQFKSDQLSLVFVRRLRNKY